MECINNFIKNAKNIFNINMPIEDEELINFVNMRTYGIAAKQK